MSKPSTATPAAQAAGAERIVDASDFAQGGVVISRVRDYEEV
jgi:hypothetical protein